MLKVGDTIFGGTFVLVEISDDYHTFYAAATAVTMIGWPPITIKFQPDQTVEDITALLQAAP